MALPTCNVVCAMHDQEGAPVAGATFEFKLNRPEVYEGFVVPTRVVGTTSDDGTCTVALWPNQLGSAESAYIVTIRSPGGRTERVTATIPNVATVNLHDVSALPPYPGKPDAQVYLEAAQGIVEDAQEAAANASNSAAQASTKAGEALASANSASAERSAAQTAREGAESAQAAAAASAGSASGSAAAASGSAAAAAASLTDINTGLASKLPIAGGAMTGNLTIPSLNGGQLAGRRRRNVNGSMVINQGGAGGNVVDMWKSNLGGSAVVTIDLTSSGPGSDGISRSLRATVGTADASIAAGDFFYLSTAIEGYDAAPLAGSTFVASFWVKSSKVGTYCVGFRNSGNATSYVVEYAVNAPNTWEKKSIVVPNGLLSGGSWNYSNGVGVSITFAAAAGSTYRTTPGAWQAGNFFATANQVNALDTAGAMFEIAGLQVEAGSSPTPFEHIDVASEYMAAFRYFRPSGPMTGITVSTTSVVGLAADFSSNPMRAAPTILLSSGSLGLVDPGVASRNISAPTLTDSSPVGAVVSAICTATTNGKLHYTTPGVFFFDARL